MKPLAPRRALALSSLLLFAAAAPAAAQSQRPAHRAMRYSCMTEPPGGMPWVAAGVPEAIEVLAPGYGIAAYVAEGAPPAGLSLWQVSGGPRRDGQSERYSYVVGWDGRRVVAGADLFVRLGADATPWRLARRALAVLAARADQRPLGPADEATLAPVFAGRVRHPARTGGRLTFWARLEPGSLYAREVVVDVATGRYVQSIPR